MVNWDFEKFRKAQKEHQAVYLGSSKKKNSGFNTDDYNTQNDTDKSVGATGRNV